MMQASDIKIDDEFEALIPPLTDDERVQLMANIERDGFRDPVVVWLGREILLDGHNRMRIWRDAFSSDPDKAPDIVEKPFKDRDDAKAWIVRNQLGRRNLTDAQRVQLALLLKPALEKQAAANKVEAGKQSGRGKVPQNSVKPLDTQKEIAKAAGVSHDTVAKVEHVLKAAAPVLQTAMQTGDISIAAAAEAADLPIEQQLNIVAAITTEDTPPARRRAARQAVREAVEIVREPKRRFKPLTEGDVHRTTLDIRGSVNTLVNRVKRQTDAVLYGFPHLSRDLRQLSQQLIELADDVDAKRQEVAR